MPSLTADRGTEIERGPLWTLAVNRNQNLLGKVLVICNRPCDAVDELTATEWSELRPLIARVRSALTDLFAPDQFNYAFLMNIDALVHLHVVPRYRTPREWDGETFDDPHWGSLFGTEQRLLDAPQLSRLTDAIRAALAPRQ